MEFFIKDKKFNDAWNVVDKSFKTKPLPKGSSVRIEENAGTYYVVVDKPIKK
jgi:hypothetical protein